MGLNATGDYYCREGDLAMAGLTDVTKVVDDILVATNTFKDNVSKTVQVLDRCRLHKITLHPRKFNFCHKWCKRVHVCLFVNFRRISITKKNIVKNSFVV